MWGFKKIKKFSAKNYEIFIILIIVKLEHYYRTLQKDPVTFQQKNHQNFSLFFVKKIAKTTGQKTHISATPFRRLSFPRLLKYWGELSIKQPHPTVNAALWIFFNGKPCFGFYYNESGSSKWRHWASLVILWGIWCRFEVKE